MKNYYDIVVVGGGPAGTVAARFAAERGMSVLILEKDRDIGYPVRCGEAISHAGVAEFIDPDPAFISSTISKFAFIAPDGTEVVIPLEEKGYILERRIFDYELAKKAADKGAEILTRAYVNGLIIDSGRVCGVKYEFRGEQKEILCKVVIAADGVESRVGRWAGIKTYTDFRDMECCVQMTVANITDRDRDTCYFYFGEKFAPQGYFWIFPKSNGAANIGLGVSGKVGKKRPAISFLNDFMEKKYPESAVLTSIAGGVPSVTTLEKISAPGIIIVGDAARQVNPLSGGGIASGMIGGSIGGRIAAESILAGDEKHLLTYDKAWNERLGKRHEIFDRIKNGIYYFTDEKFNAIAHSFSKIEYEKRTIGNLFKTALLNHPSLLIDIARVFLVR
ncbi:MAG: NAD(P)/FAD-dependent oxidoreductase [Ignavibacteriales bacterium]|nr:NAD(P)/FAD-dependent oxidoreductase [Ignavibacteriales bacterium]MCF8306482.1 NAD(P)/FAD-dependent oxidoreductase [Ignavibacteriales bacterium]MCF8316952.1 NAD(P)/FAD-dependent oxidoreductase [Ignavibacteriales bacterium]MCF8437761.1 NAD(P)/FAD-dependent oxidoreductase [Ignavibacteriales bacterium]